MPKKIETFFIIPIFLPHQGCPHRCVFCQQQTITNYRGKQRSSDEIRNTIELGIQSRKFSANKQKEVAFYGGTFTSLPISSIKEMLSVVQPYIEKGIIQSIRLSTRPDSLSEERLNILKSFSVSTVELGVQSMDDRVLLFSNRGHTSKDTVNAVKMLKSRGFAVGTQLMPGLPGDSKEIFMSTIDKVIRLQPDMVRLYPTLVIRGTKLAQLFKEGSYTPMGLKDTITLCKEACIKLENAGIPVIRIGLMSSPSLLEEGEIIAGPWHPSLGFLVRSAIHIEKIRPFLPVMAERKNILLHAPKKEISLVVGYKKSGMRHIETITRSVVKNIIPDDSIPCGEVAVKVL